MSPAGPKLSVRSGGANSFNAIALAAMRAAAEGPMKGIVEYQTDPIVSTDIIGNPHSCIFVPDQTLILDGDFAKVLAWYDNEWGYSVRTAELIGMLAAL